MVDTKPPVAAAAAEPEKPEDKKVDPEQPKDMKTYALKAAESQILSVINMNAMNTMANFMAFVCVERVAHPVDQNTVYELAPDMKSFSVWQRKVEEDKAATAPNQPQANDAPAPPAEPQAPSGNTAAALGGK